MPPLPAPTSSTQTCSRREYCRITVCTAPTTQRVAVFDFDRTLTTKHVGVFDLNSSSCINGHSNDDVAEKVFGGSGRVSMLHHMLETLEAAGVELHVVSRNSAYVVKKALAAVGLTYIQSVIGDDELARLALSPGGALWLLDEPTAGLDDTSRQAVDALIAQHLAAGGMVMAATHDPLAPASGPRELALEAAS